MTLESRVAELERIVAILQARARSGDRLRRHNEDRRGDPVLIGGGAQLRAARLRAGWTQDDIEQVIEVRKASVSRWERDQTPIVRWRAQQIVDMFKRSEREPPAWPLDGWTLQVDLYMTDGE